MLLTRRETILAEGKEGGGVDSSASGRLRELESAVSSSRQLVRRTFPTNALSGDRYDQPVRIRGET